MTMLRVRPVRPGKSPAPPRADDVGRRAMKWLVLTRRTAMSRSSISSVLVLVCLGAFAPSAFAQNAQITGVVRGFIGRRDSGRDRHRPQRRHRFDACRGH